MKLILTTWLCLYLVGCTGMPTGVTPVNEFELDRYLGKWYEIARLDHSFERGLEQVSAEYALREDGGVSVINRGYSVENDSWELAEGRAYFVNENTQGHLKVSFFGPFYGSYVIFELDQENYDYAFVSGPTTSYLWLLSRAPELPEPIVDRFKQRAAELDFEINDLIFVIHDE